MKIYWSKHGGHIHMRVFHNGKMGDLVCDEREFDHIKSCFNSRATWIEE